MPETVRTASYRTIVFCRILLICVFIIAVGSSGLRGAGSTASNFLKIPVGARASGMGEAFTSLADDASAIYWNPSGLSSLKTKEFIVSHNIWFQNIQHSYAAFVIPLDGNTFPQPFEKNTIGFSVTCVGLGDIERRTSNTSEPEGNFDASDMAVSIAFSRNVARISGHPLSFGSSLKFIRQKIDSYSADAVAADFGLMYPFSVGSLPFKAGAVVQNFGTPVKFINESYPLPLTFNAGISFLPLASHHLPLGISFDMSFPNDNAASWRLGTEYIASQLFSLRLGYSSRNDNIKDILSGSSFGKSDSNFGVFTGFMAGFGVNIPLSRGSKKLTDRINLDYAFVPYGELGETHRISLGIKW